jgi:chromosome segregation ATPase
MQPRWLIAQFEEIGHQTDYQDDVCSSSIAEVERIQALCREYLQRASQEHYSLLQQFEQHVEQFSHVKQQFVKQQDDASHLHNNCVSLQNDSDTVANDASQNLNEWQRQRAKAKDWRVAANKHVSQCQRNVTKALRDEQSAQSDLSRAQRALAIRRTQTESVYDGTDSNGNARYRRQPVCTAAEEAAVSRASAYCQSCATALRRCEQALNNAQRDLNAAEKQCQGCEKACRDANAATETALAAQDIASESESSALQAVKKLEDVGKGIENSETLLQHLNVQLDLQATMLNNLEKQVELGQTSLRDIQQQLEGLSQFMYRFKQVLNDKAALLVAFERPLTFC